MSTRKGYAVITKEKAETLSFHNLKRLMNNVRAEIGFWENTGNPGDETSLIYPETVKKNLEEHRAFFSMLREISKNHPHKDSPKLATNGSKIRRTRSTSQAS